MAFFHGARIVEFGVSGAARPVPVWPDMASPAILVPLTGNVVENDSYSIVLSASEPVTFTILPGGDGLLFNISGDVLTLPAQDYEAGQTLFTVYFRATDAAGNHTDASHSVIVVDIDDVPVGAILNSSGGYVMNAAGGFVLSA